MAQEIAITKAEARVFILKKQGLYGDYIYSGKLGAYDYVRAAGCIQFDPIDVCGKNAELTLQSRVKGFRRSFLDDLLYGDRLLVDYFDKELSIFPTEDWAYFERYRDLCRRSGRKFEGLAELEERALSYIRENGYVNSSTLPIEGEIKWNSAIHWSGNWHGKSNAARSALEQLYSTGDLVIHHKDGTRKYYDLAERHIPAQILAAPDPFPEDSEHIRWRVKRRFGSIGLLWDKNSQALWGIWRLDKDKRKRAFSELERLGEITRIRVEGEKAPFFILTEDIPFLEACLKSDEKSERCELLAPLDPMLWDRQLIECLFGFSYAWEIYVPKEKRKYGYYVLPILYGDRLVGRIEPIFKNGALTVNGLWLEEGVRDTKKLRAAIDRALRRLAKSLGGSYDPEAR